MALSERRAASFSSDQNLRNGDLLTTSTATFGKPNIPRGLQPSMFQLLSWTEPEQDDKANFKTNYKPEDELGRQWSAKIKRCKSSWVSENMDQFREFQINPYNKEEAYVDLTKDPEIHLQKSSKEEIAQKKLLPAKKTQKGRSAGPVRTKTLETPRKETPSKQQAEVVRTITKEPISHTPRRASAPNLQQKSVPIPEKNALVKKEVTSRLLDHIKKKETKVVEDPEHEKRVNQRIKTFMEQSRDLPNSAFKTFFGKPPFENYGYGNTDVATGFCYGQYLKTHNVNPHRGGNHPEYKQVFDRAEIQSAIIPTRGSSLPRTRPDDSDKKFNDEKARNPLTPEKFTKDLQKAFPKPDLSKAPYFNSRDNSPLPVPKDPVTAEKVAHNLKKVEEAATMNRASLPSSPLKPNQRDSSASAGPQQLEAKHKSNLKTPLKNSTKIEEQSTDFTIKQRPSTARSNDIRPQVVRALNFEKDRPSNGAVNKAESSRLASELKARPATSSASSIKEIFGSNRR